jgi:hypothetical protein
LPLTVIEAYLDLSMPLVCAHATPVITGSSPTRPNAPGLSIRDIVLIDARCPQPRCSQ